VGSPLYRLMVSAVPVVLTAIAAASAWFFDAVLWPLWPGTDCRRGWWLYSLVADVGDQSTVVVGLFYVTHKPTAARIIEGRAYYFVDGEVRYRGGWTAETVVPSVDSLQAVFHMKTDNPRPLEFPRQYDGFFSISRTRRSPRVGESAWEGFFQDLG